jgi:hypothetical protein
MQRDSGQNLEACFHPQSYYWDSHDRTKFFLLLSLLWATVPDKGKETLFGTFVFLVWILTQQSGCPQPFPLLLHILEKNKIENAVGPIPWITTVLPDQRGMSPLWTACCQKAPPSDCRLLRWVLLVIPRENPTVLSQRRTLSRVLCLCPLSPVGWHVPISERNYSSLGQGLSRDPQITAQKVLQSESGMGHVKIPIGNSDPSPSAHS